MYLTYHSANGRMMCHYCGYSEKSSEACPECGGAMKHIGVGTQRAEEELHALFPGGGNPPHGRRHRRPRATRRSSADFQERRVPILLGTQMVAKGLDFANVTLVGVLAADLSLYVDHYRASERTFSLLTQVVGRAGRGDKPGPGGDPDLHPGKRRDPGRGRTRTMTGFMTARSGLRQLRRDPPFADQFIITVTGPQEEPRVRRAAAARSAGRDCVPPPRHGSPISGTGPG